MVSCTPGGPSPRARVLVALAVFFALYALALFHPLVAHLVTGAPARWLEGDVPEEYWPDLVHLCRSLARGVIPRWSPYEHAGVPFYADPQAGVFHPGNLALCLLAGPHPSLPWADARVVLGFALAGFAMAVFLHGEGLSLPAAIAGGVLFPLTPFLRHNWELNLTLAFAWLPLVLRAVRVACERPESPRAALLGLAFALQVLVGSPPAVYFSLLVVVPFGLHAALRPGPSARPSTLSRRGATLALAALLGTALVLPAVAPALELSRASVQSVHSFAAIAAEGLRPRALLGFVLPELTDHFYPGLLALALAARCFAAPSPLRARGLLAGLALVAAVLALGAHTPLFRAAFALLPGAASFRNPTRYSAVSGTCVAVLAAAGLDAFLRADPAAPRPRVWIASVAAGALAALTLHFVPVLDPLTHGKGLLRAGLSLALGAGALLAMPAFPRARLPLAVLATGALVADLAPLLPPERHTRAGPLPEGGAALASLRAVAGSELPAFRVWDEFAIGLRPGSRHGLRELRGYQDPLSLSRYQKLVGALWEHPTLLASFNVRWVLRGAHYLHGYSHHLLPDPAGSAWAVARAPGVYELPGALPLAYWMDGAVAVPDADAALEAVAAREGRPVVALEALELQGEALALGTGAFRPLGATLRDDAVVVHVHAPADGWVLVNEAYYPGWQATLDGRPARILRANSFVRAVRVPRGRHRLAMVFRPWQPRVFEPIALAALVVAVALVAAPRLRRRGSSPA